jgi:hypothetical protein
MRLVDRSQQRCQTMEIASFETDLIDADWLMIEPLRPASSRLGRL